MEPARLISMGPSSFDTNATHMDRRSASGSTASHSNLLCDYTMMARGEPPQITSRKGEMAAALVRVGQFRFGRGPGNGSAGVVLRDPCCSECTIRLGSRGRKGHELRATRPC